MVHKDQQSKQDQAVMHTTLADKPRLNQFTAGDSSMVKESALTVETQ